VPGWGVEVDEARLERYQLNEASGS
jgi:hypothetical protein